MDALTYRVLLQSSFKNREKKIRQKLIQAEFQFCFTLLYTNLKEMERRSNQGSHAMLYWSPIIKYILEGGKIKILNQAVLNTISPKSRETADFMP